MGLAFGHALQDHAQAGIPSYCRCDVCRVQYLVDGSRGNERTKEIVGIFFEQRRKIGGALVQCNCLQEALRLWTTSFIALLSNAQPRLIPRYQPVNPFVGVESI